MTGPQRATPKQEVPVSDERDICMFCGTYGPGTWHDDQSFVCSVCKFPTTPEEVELEEMQHAFDEKVGTAEPIPESLKYENIRKPWDDEAGQ